MFCPKCGGLLVPKSEKGKKKLCCSRCKYIDKEEKTETKFVENIESGKKIEVIESSTELETLPKVEAECPKCKHKKAYFWTVQTRASDEPETKFYKCERCKHTWRDYS